MPTLFEQKKIKIKITFLKDYRNFFGRVLRRANTAEVIWQLFN